MIAEALLTGIGIIVILLLVIRAQHRKVRELRQAIKATRKKRFLS